MQATSKSNTAVHSRHTATEGLPNQEMSAAERLDIEREANRVFVDGKQAHQFRLRQVKERAVSMMLAGGAL